MTVFQILFFISVFLLLVIVYLTESDRNLYIPHSFKNYYYNYFPIQPLNGIHNSLYHHYAPMRVVYPLEELSFHHSLVSYQSQIRREVEGYSFSQLQQYGYNATQDMDGLPESDYHYLRLWFYGHRYKEADYFPILDSIRQRHPEVRTMFFSLMKGKKHVDIHRGSYNGVLRYHFPIKGGDDTVLQIMRTVTLSSAKPFIFDDTYPHSLTKSGSSIRIVLICDIDNRWSPFKSLQFHRYLDYRVRK